MEDLTEAMMLNYLEVLLTLRLQHILDNVIVCLSVL